jgi:hypothetical protein
MSTSLIRGNAGACIRSGVARSGRVHMELLHASWHWRGSTRLARNVPRASKKTHQAPWNRTSNSQASPQTPTPSRHLLVRRFSSSNPPLPSPWRTARRGTDTRVLHTSLEPTPAVKLERVSHHLPQATVQPQHLDMERPLRLHMAHLRQRTEPRRLRMEHRHPPTGSLQPRTPMRSANSSGR